MADGRKAQEGTTAMNHMTASFTLVSRPTGRLLEVALGGAEVRVVGTTTLAGTPDEVFDSLPANREIVAVNHADGSVYGYAEGEGRGITYLGNLLDLLGFKSLDRRFREEPAVMVSLGCGQIVIATRCLRKAMGKPLGETVLDLREGRPQLMSRPEVVTLLLEALVALSERRLGNGRNPAMLPSLTVGDIFVDLIPIQRVAA